MADSCYAPCCTLSGIPKLKAVKRGMEIPPYSVNVRDAVFDLLRRLGLTTVFGNPGSTELPMFRSFPRDFRYVLGLQEAVVVGMADGYAQATGSASLVSLHSAAGVGNAMGNIFTAFKNRTPMVITAGQQARSILPYDPFLASSHPPSYRGPMSNGASNLHVRTTFRSQLRAPITPQCCRHAGPSSYLSPQRIGTSHLSW
jgi:hypothetical protein